MSGKETTKRLGATSPGPYGVFLTAEFTLGALELASGSRGERDTGFYRIGPDGLPYTGPTVYQQAQHKFDCGHAQAGRWEDIKKYAGCFP